MKTHSQHIEFSRLADLAENRVAENELGSYQQHLAGCSQCADDLRQIARTIELMVTDDSEDAPRDVLMYAMNVFQRSREQTLLRRIVASLTFDSLTSAPAFGVRSGQSATRQLLYSAEDTDIDLRVTKQNEEWVITGQVLREDCAGGSANIEGASGAASTQLNDECEFNLSGLSSGRYTLRFKLADIELEIPQIELTDQ